MLLIAAVAVGLWVPLARLEWFSGHEQAAYILRTVEWAAEFRRGALFPRWCPDFYGGFGSPMFLFYGPIPYGAAGVLTATLMDPVSALKVVVLLASLMSGFGMYALVYGETRQRDAALLAALAYLANPYRVANLFQRGDLGEFVAMAVIPVVIALYRAAARQLLPQRARWLGAAAVGAHAIMIMTHPIFGLWGTIITGLVVAGTAVGLARRGLRRRALLFVGLLACAPGLAAIYTAPAIAYRSATHTAGMVVGFYNPLDHWIWVRSLFEESVLVFNPNFLRVGPLLAIGLGVAAVGLAVNPRKGRAAVGWVAMTVGLVYLMSPYGSWFFVPGRIPLATFIQFPWRLVGLASMTACVALGLGMAAASWRATDSLRGAIAIAGGAAMLLTMPWTYVTTREMKTEGVARDPDSIRQGQHSATDADEYLPHAAPTPPRTSRRELVLEASGAKAREVVSDGSRHWLTVEASRGDATVLLALHNFPGWKVQTLSGPAQATLDTDERGQMRVRFPSAGSYRVHIWFGSPTAEKIGLLISALSALALALLVTPVSRWWRSRPRPLVPGVAT